MFTNIPDPDLFDQNVILIILAQDTLTWKCGLDTHLASCLNKGSMTLTNSEGSMTSKISSSSLRNITSFGLWVFGQYLRRAITTWQQKANGYVCASEDTPAGSSFQKQTNNYLPPTDHKVYLIHYQCVRVRERETLSPLMSATSSESLMGKMKLWECTVHTVNVSRVRRALQTNPLL